MHDDDDVSGGEEEEGEGPIKDGEEWDVYGVDSEVGREDGTAGPILFRLEVAF